MMVFPDVDSESEEEAAEPVAKRRRRMGPEPFMAGVINAIANKNPLAFDERSLRVRDEDRGDYYTQGGYVVHKDYRSGDDGVRVRLRDTVDYPRVVLSSGRYIDGIWCYVSHYNTSDFE
jgi:hypothetical protein